MRKKVCVGAVIYNKEGKIFLMKSPKWKGYVVPGGEIEKGESEGEALKREIKEEMGVDIEDVEKIGESKKSAGSDFHDERVSFEFKDYVCRAKSSEITPNEEISDFGWYTPEEALELSLVDSTRKLIKKFLELR